MKLVGDVSVPRSQIRAERDQGACAVTETSLLIPVKQHRASGGRFVVPAQAILASPSASDLLPLKQLADDLARVGTKARLARNAFGPAALRIHREREVLLGPGAPGLRLVVSPGTNAWGSHGCRLRMGMENIAALAKEGVARGVDGLINTDWGDEGQPSRVGVGEAHLVAHEPGRAAVGRVGSVREHRVHAALGRERC